MKALLNVSRSQRAVTAAQYDAVVVGGGPYGLSAAAHLLDHGLAVAVFGKPLQLWRENMPKGMLLRSYQWATKFSDPHKQYGLEPISLERSVSRQQIPSQQKRLSNMDSGFKGMLSLMLTYVETIERKEGNLRLPC